jgi:RHS repeat-associated protein
MTLVLDSYFDPLVEFSEVGVALNGKRTWKIIGPDGDHSFGSMQGVGGLEATVRESDLQTTAVLSDFYGNVQATISGSGANWNPVRVSGYGPEIGYAAAALTPGTPLAESLVWRTRRIDPTGLYWLGARYYDPMAGRFLTPDPLGHNASMDLYSFADGDPINHFDADGRFAKGIAYGIGDQFEGGSYYKSFLNPHSGWSEAGYYTGVAVAEVTKQAALYFATEGAFALMARGLAAGARALATEVRVGGEALMGETAAARGVSGAFGMGGEMSMGLEGASTVGRNTLGAQRSFEMGPYLLIAEGDGPVWKRMSQMQIELLRGRAAWDLMAAPGKVGFSSGAPLFLSKPNQSGGRVWLSTFKVNTADSEVLVSRSLQKSRVTIISGVHGSTRGALEPFEGIVKYERGYFAEKNMDVEILDLMKMSQPQLREVLQRDGNIICSWCFSRKTHRVIEGLWGKEVLKILAPHVILP